MGSGRRRESTEGRRIAAQSRQKIISPTTLNEERNAHSGCGSAVDNEEGTEISIWRIGGATPSEILCTPRVARRGFVYLYFRKELPAKLVDCVTRLIAGRIVGWKVLWIWKLVNGTVDYRGWKGDYTGGAGGGFLWARKKRNRWTMDNADAVPRETLSRALAPDEFRRNLVICNEILRRSRVNDSRFVNSIDKSEASDNRPKFPRTFKPRIRTRRFLIFSQLSLQPRIQNENIPDFVYLLQS